MKYNSIFILFLLVCGLYPQSHCNAQEYEYIFEDFSDAISDDFVHSICADRRGNLWGSTRQDVFMYDGVTVEKIEEFRQFESVHKLEFDQNGMLWFRIAKSPLQAEIPYVQIYNPQQKQFLKLQEYCSFIDEKLDLSLPFNMYSDKRKELWVQQKYQFFRYRNDSIIHVIDTKPNLLDFHIFNHLVMLKNNPPASTNQLYDLESLDLIGNYKSNFLSSSSMYYEGEFIIKTFVENNLNYILYDRNGQLLVKGKKSSIKTIENEEDIYLSFDEHIYIYSKKNGTLNSLSTHKSAMDGKIITKGLALGNVIWFQTNGGLFRMYKQEVVFNHELSDPKYRVRKILELDENKLLIVADRYLVFHDVQRKFNVQFEGLYACSNATLWDKNTLHANMYSPGLAIFQFADDYSSIGLHPDFGDKNDVFLYGSYQTDSILLLATVDKLIYRKKAESEFIDYPVSIPSTAYVMQKSDLESCLFLLGAAGLSELNVATRTLETFDELSNFHISAIIQRVDFPKEYWISTKYGGLILWHRNKGILKHWTKENGLSNNNIHAAYPDNRGRLWMSSDWGINILDIQSDEISILTKKDGLKENEMNRYAHYRAPDGKLYFGSQKGFFSFYPSKYNFKKIDNPVTLKYLKYILPRSGLDHKIDISNRNQAGIYLKRNFINPKLILSPPPTGLSVALRYRFRDQADWQYLENNEISLKEITKNSDILISRKNGFDSWSIPEVYQIYYQLPVYQRTWFIISSILLIAALIILYLAVQNRRRKKVNDRIRQEIKLRTQELVENNDKLKASKQLNDQIFSIIGHDLRSPIISLSTVTDSIHYLIEKGEEKELKKLASSVDKNANKLLNLVDKLLQWATAQRKELNTSRRLKIYEEVKEAIQHLYDEAAKKNIDFHFPFRNSNVEINSDKESFQIILRNLIQNSIKFSEVGKSIHINIEKEDQIKLIIRDEGIGFPPNILEKFTSDEFMHSRIGTEGEIGSGLGLSLSRELIIKLGAQLKIESTEHIGSTFTILFPVN